MAVCVALALPGCGETVPHGGVPVSPTAPPAAEQPAMRAADLIPADLDLVLRIDLGRLRRSLGPEPWDALAERTQVVSRAEGVVREALGRADVVWLGLRVADWDAGDRVLVVELPEGSAVTPDPFAWRRRQGYEPPLAVYDAIDSPPRHGTARIVLVGERAAAFVSPVEVSAVERVMRAGPDPERGEPNALGLLSLDWRARGLSSGMQERYPSLAALVGGIARVHATVSLTGGELELEGRLRCRDESAAARVLRFVQTIIEGAEQSPRYRGLLARMTARQAEGTVLLRWTVPSDAVRALLRAPAPADRAGALEEAGLGLD